GGGTAVRFSLGRTLFRGVATLQHAPRSGAHRAIKSLSRTTGGRGSGLGGLGRGKSRCFLIPMPNRQRGDTEKQRQGSSHMINTINTWKTSIWQQFGAAIDTLDSALSA